MNLSELRYGEHFLCRIEPYLNQQKPLVDPQHPQHLLGVVLQKAALGSDAYMVQVGDKVKKVRLLSCPDVSAFENRLLAGQTNLYEVKHILSNNQLDIEVVFFRKFRKFPQPFLVNVTEALVDKENEFSVQKSGFSRKDEDNLCNILRAEFTLGNSSNPYFLFMERSPEKADVQDENNLSEAYTLINKDWQLIVQSGKVENETALFATGIKKHIPRNYETSVCLAQGKLHFSYLTSETISELNAVEMKKDMDEGNSYIGEWDKYNAEIGKRLLATARQVGFVAVSSKPEKVTTHELLFHFSYTGGNKQGNFSNLLIETDSVDIVQELPDYLKNHDMTYEEWIGEIDREIEQEQESDQKSQNDDEKEQEKRQERERKKWSNLKIIECTDDSITLDIKKNKGTPERGENGELYIILSLFGEKIQIERRRRVRQNIIRGKSEIGNLGLILDGKENCASNIIPPQNTITKLPARIQKKVFSKVFKFDPTEKQKEAIRIALTTPDIALIQGPPGTGKSTVICGIVECLNEIFQKDNNVAGKIFISSLQHDAVENITERLSINALPTVKFGRSSSEDELSFTATEKRIENWRQNTAKRIEEKLAAVIESEAFQKQHSLFLNYHEAPSNAMEIELLNGIKQLSPRFTTPKLLEKIDAILEDLAQEDSFETADMLQRLYALRTNETAFLDDGTQRARELAIHLKEEQILIPDCLNKACRYEAGSDLNFLSDLETFKNELLEQYIPRTEFRHEKENAVISDIVNEVSQRIQTYPFDPKEKRNIALADFVYELKNNPIGITNTLLSYNPVFTATVQQGEGREINKARKRLKLDTHDRKTPYEYVIIDEAARVAPPDLLIPMAKGKHIILVGDHRQLPQQVDQDIERKMEESAANKEEIEFLNQSTFERLFSQLDASKKITLDKQYRMHPLLGNFISKEFYEVHNPEEGFESPLQAELFEYALPLIENKAAVWCHVQNEITGDGAEMRSLTKSRYRRREAIIAAKLLKKWLEHDTKKKLTFGVISFYSAQCDEIKRQLKDIGICDKNFKINDEYQYTAEQGANVKERIRIGTVDAFQGMEFDVVILCTVRTASKQKMKNIYDETQKNAEEGLKRQQGLFGFLMSKNRLCVSMSRQKKALVVIGDKNLFASDIAETAVPELTHYVELCRTDGLVCDEEYIMDGTGNE